jgi:hypothetical protein
VAFEHSSFRARRALDSSAKAVVSLRYYFGLPNPHSRTQQHTAAHSPNPLQHPESPAPPIPQPTLPQSHHRCGPSRRNPPPADPCWPARQLADSTEKAKSQTYAESHDIQHAAVGLVHFLEFCDSVSTATTTEGRWLTLEDENLSFQLICWDVLEAALLTLANENLHTPSPGRRASVQVRSTLGRRLLVAACRRRFVLQPNILAEDGERRGES